MDAQNHNIGIAIVNFNVQHGDKNSNLKKIIEFIVDAAKMGADLVLFPEMCLTGYDFYIDDEIEKEKKINLAETIPGPSTDQISEITKELKIFAVFGMPEKVDDGSGRLFNSAVVVGPEGLVGVYRKIHPFDKENTWCNKGNQPFMFHTKWGPIGIGICYDTYHFPELMRYYAWKGCKLYLNLTAIIREPGIPDAFKEGYLTYLKSGVLTNHIFIASANLVGRDQSSLFGGGSVIVGPKAVSPNSMIFSTCYGGDVDNNQEGIFAAKVDLSQAKRTIFQKNQYTQVPDYQPDLYMGFNC